MPEAEGWTWLLNARKWHYFVEGRSLCGRYLLLASGEFQRGDDDSPDNCAACKRQLAKRKEAANAER